MDDNSLTLTHTRTSTLPLHGYLYVFIFIYLYLYVYVDKVHIRFFSSSQVSSRTRGPLVSCCGVPFQYSPVRRHFFLLFAGLQWRSNISILPSSLF